MHIVAQVNHRGLGVKVETNCLRDSDLGPGLQCLLKFKVDLN